MGCFYCCCCTLLVLINIVYMIIGLALTIAGILFNVARDLVGSFIKPIIEAELKRLGNSKIDVQNALNYLFSNMSSISIALIIVGLILFVLSILGMCSVCCKSQIAIIVYITILSVILVVQIIALIIFAAKPELVKEGLTSVIKAMIKKYKGFTNTDVESFLINILGITMNCCGANNYKDFDDAKEFNRTFEQKFTYNNKDYDYKATLIYPISCCQFVNYDFVDARGCIEQGTSNNKDTGCTDKLYKEMITYIDMVYKVAGGIIGFQGFLLIAGVICLVSLKQDSDVKPV